MSARKYLEEGLAEMNMALKEMCVLVEDMIDQTVTALTENDTALAAGIHARDKKVDEYEMDIERMCMRLLLKEQPVAADFRSVSTTLKVITDIERIGDQAGDIGELIAANGGVVLKADAARLRMMGILAKDMVKNSVDSFIFSDEKLADETAKKDDRMDELFIEVKNGLIAFMKEKPDNADDALVLMMIAKYFERIGDHAVNVCEWTKYEETGEHVKFQ